MNLQENIFRIKEVMGISEQSENNLQSMFNEFKSGNFSELKSFLTSNQNITDLLKSILGTSTIEDTFKKLTTSNKTTLMKGMTDAKNMKNMDLYNLLDIFLQSSESLS